MKSRLAYKRILSGDSITFLFSFMLLFSVAFFDERSDARGVPLQNGTQDWSGCFYEIYGTRPQGFEEFVNFYVISFPGQPISGGLSTKLKKSAYAFATVRVTGDYLTFTTITFKSIKYGFEGRLLKRPRIENEEIVREPVAEGTLRKYRRGKLVAESKVSFACVAGDD